MRSDMAKVIVERPRYGSTMRGHAKGYWRKLQAIPADELPKRERIKPSHGRTKSLNEHLRPLQRYLHKQIGRPWDKVFAEICAFISRNSAVQDHVRDHVGDFVAVNVIEIDGVLHEVAWWGRLIPLEKGWRYATLYVCPRTGLLKNLGKKSRRSKHEKESPTIHVTIDYQVTFIRRRGVWHRLQLKPIPKKRHNVIHAVVANVFDSFLQKLVTRAEAVSFYGRGVYATEARPATWDEIRKHCEPLKTPNRV